MSGRTNETRGGTFARLFVLSLARSLACLSGAIRDRRGSGGVPIAAASECTALGWSVNVLRPHTRACTTERTIGWSASYVRFLRVPVSRDTSRGTLVLLTCARSRTQRSARIHAYAYRAIKRHFEAVDAANLIDVAMPSRKHRQA